MLEAETLIDYLEGRLPEPRRREVEGHLAGCERCIEELQLVHEALSDAVLMEYEAPPPRLTRQVARQIRKEPGSSPDRQGSVFDAWKAGLSGHARRWGHWRRRQLVPVRGGHAILGSDVWETEKSFADIGVRIEMHRTGDDRAEIRVQALRVPENASSLRVTLCRAKREVSSFLVADTPALFEDIVFDHYRLVFTVYGRVKGMYSFEIRGSPHGR